MIAKCIKGTGFRGAVEYDLQPHKSLLLKTNMIGQNPRELTKEFGAIRVLRPKLSKAVCHVSISLSPEESLTDDQWRHVAQTWLQGMGFEANQYMVSRHTDAAHSHIHILVNRVTFDGQVVSDAYDYKRQEPIMRALEQELGLQQVLSSRDSPSCALRKGELEKALRTGEKPVCLALQEAVTNALRDSPCLDTFTERLAQKGVTVKLNQSSTGHVSGISFAKDDIAFKGSKLGKAFTWNALQERGLLYEQDGLSTKHGREGTHTSDTSAPQRGDSTEWGASETRSAPDNIVTPRGGKDQELAGTHQAFEAIKQHYLTDNRKRSTRRSGGQKRSR